MANDLTTIKEILSIVVEYPLISIIALALISIIAFCCGYKVGINKNINSQNQKAGKNSMLSQNMKITNKHED